MRIHRHGLHLRAVPRHQQQLHVRDLRWLDTVKPAGWRRLSMIIGEHRPILSLLSSRTLRNLIDGGSEGSQEEPLRSRSHEAGMSESGEERTRSARMRRTHRLHRPAKEVHPRRTSACPAVSAMEVEEDSGGGTRANCDLTHRDFTGRASHGSRVIRVREFEHPSTDSEAVQIPSHWCSPATIRVTARPAALQSETRRPGPS